ncbi:PREDICTED: ceramide synthase 4-like [Lepidothrix coronata]|uniref:Ceramide synthase 4-like n=1 Tax=Lepidothrix coronata TaxID=321398 RepID=A0A6J0ISR5_9PASS|nr:PREDICTED: ceramide synthase 4-like [Lepidothrix coronata]
MGVSGGFWHHEFWLPPGATWEDLKESADTHYPQPQDLLLCIPGALLLIFVRCLFERTVALPLGRGLGVRDKKRPKVQPNATLESFYVLLGRTPKEEDLISLAKQSDLPIRKVETWFRHRRAQDHPRLMKKFCEASWRFTFYFTSFFSGLALLYDKPWFWDPTMCWLKFPQQPLPPALGWFYLLELSFYCSLVATLPFDVKRKDFKEQIIHHIATITLIFVSYCANMIRFGMMVMLVHDASDYILELAKMLHYLKWQRVCDAVFFAFAVVFILSRLVLFPLIVYYYFVTKLPLFPISCLINAFLGVLQLLHIFWSYLIIHMIFSVIFRGGKRQDARSDTEESDRSEAEDPAKNQE